MLGNACALHSQVKFEFAEFRFQPISFLVRQLKVF